MCFPDDAMNSSEEYVSWLIGLLHDDLEERSSSSTSSSQPSAKRMKRSVVVNGVKFKFKRRNEGESSHTRWELFVILNAKKQVDASCLVLFNDLYQTCEIHEVCVATTGQGYCKQLIGQVRDHIIRGDSGKMREIRVYCNRSNIAACKCYASVFSKSLRIDRPQTSAFVFVV